MKKKRIIFIGEYLLSFPGGAEKSIWEELLSYKKKGYEVEAHTFDSYTNIVHKTIKKINITNYGLQKVFKFSRLIELELNKKFILKKLETIKFKKSDIVLTQNLLSPIVAKLCIKKNINYFYYLRDELQLNQFENYEVGIKKQLKKIKLIIESSTIKKYKKANLVALKNAKKIIVNSKYMQNELLNKFNLKSELKYPKVKKPKIKKAKKIYITFIGGNNSMKGYNIILRLAKKLPKEKFLIIGNYKKKMQNKNITKISWTKDLKEIYSKTKILLVPSRWNEAFGRVVLEANMLNIPVITSNKGGLPEANRNKNNIISDVENTDLWVKKIKQQLKAIEK